MFSGIIENKVKILSIDGGKFTLTNIFGNDLQKGQSIAHDGACMTIVDFDDSTYSFFVMQESFDKTNFGTKKVGDYFNVERCLGFGSRVDGHFVQGHVDGVGKVVDIKDVQDGSRYLYFSFPRENNKLLIKKGSIAVNGTSLTVVECGDGVFSVSLIPLTLEVTNLGNLKIGDIVNLEFDMIGKYILRNFELHNIV